MEGASTIPEYFPGEVGALSDENRLHEFGNYRGRVYLVKLFERFVQGLTWRTAQVAQIALFISMAIIMVNIFMRIPWQPLPGTVEIVEMTGAVLLALGVAYTAIMKGHIMVGVLVERFSARVQAAIEIFVSIVSLIFTYLLAREILFFAISSMQRGYTTGHLYWPIAPAIYIVAFGFIMLALVLILDLLKAVILITKRSESG